MYLWLADLLTPTITESWLEFLELVTKPMPRRFAPDYALSVETFSASEDVVHTRIFPL
ncbi:metallo-beta-lactamase domain-containing protein [Colletotrichum tabaci]|uniref:Metallo-beta-lactamase domain-containing protein n=1 Tax=Colletotrichum tabaci TaxID=1209068 RepID=A0AAV9TPB4_9PEZI